MVIDITALATLRLLNLETVLSSTKFHFIISERTWVTLREMLSEARYLPAPSGTFFYKDGKHVMYEETEADRNQRHQEDEEFVRLIEKATERRSGVGLAALQPEKREPLEKFFGPYGAESMILASDPDCALWTDDLIQAQTSAQEFGSRRVWTQLVLGALTDAGLLAPEEYSIASANLIGMEFVATLFDSTSMLAAFKLASWSEESRPAAQIVSIFSDPNTDLQSLFGIYVEFTMRLYREPVIPEVRCSVTRAFLEAFACRPGAIALLSNLRKLSSRMFGVNGVGKDQFDECFDRWIERRNRPLIYPP